MQRIVIAAPAVAQREILQGSCCKGVANARLN
jgi:hypothetical protein